MRIGIVGSGLIGGSILKSLYGKGHHFTVVTRNRETLENLKPIADVASDNLTLIKDAEIVFVCTPMSVIPETLDKLEKTVNSDCTVTDVGSVKTFISNKKRPYNFIPGHPMAGTEHCGYNASFGELFIGAKWVLTPIDNNSNIGVLTDIIKQTGAIPIITTPREHDEAVALISHLPMYIAQSLFKSAENNKLAMLLASSGFRDTTRLAVTNLKLASDMFKYNGENIEKAKNKFKNIIDSLITNYEAEVPEIIKSRSEMYSESGKNIIKPE